MESTPNTEKEQKAMGFGKTMLASAVGCIIAFAAINLLTFLLCIGILASAVSKTESATVVTGSNLAVELDLTQAISERTPSELASLLGDNSGTSIEQLLKAIENAATDEKIKALYLHLGGSNLSWAQAEELQEALSTFREECDKPIFAYGETLSQPEYFLATAADTIGLHPSGAIDFRGMGAEAMFYKGLLDKMGVNVELIRPTSCAYKSAGETFTRTNMSDANREQVRAYINSIWDYALDVMSSRRHIAKDSLNLLADNLAGYLPEEALRHHLVDTLCFQQDVKEWLRENHNVSKIVKANRYAKSITRKDQDDRIAIIYAEGDVVPGKGKGTQVAVFGDDIVKALTSAAKDKKVKAIVLRVNSPGGAVTASEAMTHAVIEAKKEKPVIVSMSGLAASAGYEISCFATKIVAHPTTLTGSIGVFATVPEVSNLLRQKLGITTDTVMTNANSTGLSLFRPLSPTARATMQQSVEEFYITFTQRVADGRGLTRTYVDSIARGRVWTGLQAKEIGLVDTLGGLPLALHIAAEEAGVDYEKCSISKYPSQKSLWDQLMDNLDEEEEEAIRSRLNAIIPFYSDLEAWATMEPLQARLPFVLKID